MVGFPVVGNFGKMDLSPPQAPNRIYFPCFPIFPVGFLKGPYFPRLLTCWPLQTRQIDVGSGCSPPHAPRYMYVSLPNSPLN